MLVNASFSMPPQVGTDRSPSPRNSSPDCTPIAMPVRIAVWMMMGARTTERMWRLMMRTSLSPATRAAST